MLFYSQTPLGILGGGQLARMLALSAHRQGIAVKVVSAQKDDPAAQVTSQHYSLLWDDSAALQKALESARVWVFESELIPLDLLEKLSLWSEESSWDIFPNPSLMALFSHRAQQKKFLEEHSLPTAAFIHWPESSQQNLTSCVEKLKSRGGDWVLKTCRGGYDGRGTFFFTSKTLLREVSDFLEKAQGGLIAEHAVAFVRELAFSVVRSRTGKVRFLPLVETHQSQGSCDWVKGPVIGDPTTKSRRDSLLQENYRKLCEQIAQVLKKIDYVGLITFELFELADHSLMINEVAPRVHNSAHYSMDALSYSQFDFHLQAYYEPELASWKLLAPGFAMANLLGTREDVPHYREEPGARLHGYGKQESRIRRKMGHLNVLAETPEKALSQVLEARRRMWL